VCNSFFKLTEERFPVFIDANSQELINVVWVRLGGNARRNERSLLTRFVKWLREIPMSWGSRGARKTEIWHSLSLRLQSERSDLRDRREHGELLVSLRPGKTWRGHPRFRREDNSFLGCGFLQRFNELPYT